MAYLDRQLSEYRTSAPLINHLINNEASVSHPVNNKPVEEVKSSNHHLAKVLADAKTELIKHIAQFPVTALWLINKYEQNTVSPSEQEDEESTDSDLAISINDIKKSYQQYCRYLQNSNVIPISCKQSLMFRVQLFPFTFSDLTDVTEFIFYGVQTSSLPTAPINSLTEDLFEKRLETIRPSNKMDTLKAMKLSVLGQASESFLFLPHGDIRNHLTKIILAEKQWLKARQDLVMANNKLVSFIVNQYKGCFLDFNDLVQEGQTGLLKAVDRFDYRLGFQFSTYAGYWIRQAISRALSRSERSVRIPCEQVANINRVFRAKDQITTQTGKEASVQEIADFTQLSCADINNILAISQGAIPLEGTDDEDNEKSFAPVDFLEQQTFAHALEEIAATELEGLLKEAIKTLNPREAQVVCCHFGIHSGMQMTLQEIGQELNLTRERVRQIQVIALNKIKLNYGQQLINFL